MIVINFYATETCRAMELNFEEKLNLAKSLIANGTSIRGAARNSGIPFSTLQKKLKTHENRLFKGGKSPVLTWEEENDLEKWVLFMESWGMPRTRRNVISQVKES